MVKQGCALWAALPAALFAAACADAGEHNDAQPVSEKVAPSKISVLPGQSGDNWRAIDPDYLAIIQTRHGDILIELNPAFAPTHVSRFQEMARARAYNGTHFYRVIDGFVAQGGLNDKTDTGKWPNLPIENERVLLTDGDFEPLGNSDLFAPETGHLDGFAVARSPAQSREWLLHCPGAVVAARNSDPNSGGTEFYIVLDAQRYLDRNMTVFGRVVSGMQYVQKLKRGDPDSNGGVISPEKRPDEIISIKLAAELAEEERPHVEVMRTNSSAFKAAKRNQRVQRDPFFINTPPEMLDICDTDTPTRRLR